MMCCPPATQAMLTATGIVITMAGSINAVATTMGAALTPTAITMAGNTTTVATIDTTEAVGASHTHHPTAADTTGIQAAVKRPPFGSWGQPSKREAATAYELLGCLLHGGEHSAKGRSSTRQVSGSNREVSIRSHPNH